jgi:hypothetical protein
MQPLRLGEHPATGTNVVFSRRFLQSKVLRAERRDPSQHPGLEKGKEILEHYLAPHPEWEYLMDTGDVVLVKVDPPPDGSPPSMDLIGPTLFAETPVATWNGGPHGTDQITYDENCVTFRIPAQSTKPLSFYTFPGRWSKPVEGLSDLFLPMCRGNTVALAVTYELSDDVTSLALTLAEFDERQPLSLKTCFLPTEKGAHRFDDIMALSDSAQSLRAAVRVSSEKDANLTFHQFEVSAMPGRETPRFFASSPDETSTRVAVREHDHATQ